MASPELHPVATMTAQLGATHVIAGGPKGGRVIVDVTGVDVVGDRLTATMAGSAGADWLTLGPDGTYGTLDVRVTLRTDDDVVVYVEYSGKIDLASGTAVSGTTVPVRGRTLRLAQQKPVRRHRHR